MQVFRYEKTADGIVLTEDLSGLCFDKQEEFERFARQHPEELGVGTFMLVALRKPIQNERIEQYKMTILTPPVAEQGKAKK